MPCTLPYPGSPQSEREQSGRLQGREDAGGGRRGFGSRRRGQGAQVSGYVRLRTVRSRGLLDTAEGEDKASSGERRRKAAGGRPAATWAAPRRQSRPAPRRQSRPAPRRQSRRCERVAVARAGDASEWRWDERSVGGDFFTNLHLAVGDRVEIARRSCGDAGRYERCRNARDARWRLREI